jgi:hypothetical protein
MFWRLYDQKTDKQPDPLGFHLISSSYEANKREMPLETALDQYHPITILLCLAKSGDGAISSLPKTNNSMYNPSHDTEPQANHSCSSCRYMRVIETCHGLRLNEEIQSPETNRFGTFSFPSLRGGRH